MVGRLDVSDQLIQTPLKLIESESERELRGERKGGKKTHTERRIKVHGAEKMDGNVRGEAPGLTCAVAGRRREGRRGEFRPLG